MLDARINLVPAMRNLEIAETTYVDHEFPRHLHETYVIEVVVKGNVAFECNGKNYLATKGSIILLDPGQVHTGRSADGKAVAYRSFHPTKKWMQWISNEEQPTVFKSVTVQDRPLAHALINAHNAFQKNEETLHAEGLISLAFSKLLSEQSDTSSASSSPRSIKRAKEYLENAYSCSVQLSELAEISCLSPFYFLRAFKKATGLTPHEYLCNLRVEKARQLLTHGMSIAETAAQTGFFDQSHLHRHFRRILGVTPGKYRAILSKKKTCIMV